MVVKKVPYQQQRTKGRVDKTVGMSSKPVVVVWLLYGINC